MKNIFKILIAVVLTSSVFVSCETTELEDLASPNSLSPDQADADLLLNSIQLAYRNSVATFNNNGAALSRINYMFGRNYFSNFGSGTLNGVWSNFYSNMLVNTNAIAALGESNADKDVTYHLGMAKAMQGHVLMLLVDYLGEAPYSQANNPAEYPNPSTDDGQSLYAAAGTLLDEAAAHFAATSGIGTGTDIYYGGDADKWVKLINTLKMRANLTTGNYAAVIGASNVISDTADDFVFAYGTNELSPDTRHPDYAADYTSSGANIYQSNWLMDTMIGQYGDLSSSTDPRRRYYFYRQNWRTPGSYALFRDVNGAFGAPGTIYISNGDGNGETLSCSIENVPTHLEFTPDEDRWCSMHLGYWGRTHGDDDGTPPDNFTRTAVGVYPAGGSFDWREDAFPYVGDSPTATFGQAVGLGNGGGGAGIEPIMLASYADFMKAEAYLATGDIANAAVYMESAMTKSIAKVMSFGSLDGGADMSQAPNQATVDKFIADKVSDFISAPTNSAADGFGFPTTNDKWDILGEQLFVALYGGSADAHNFIRRTGYPRTLSRSLEANPGTYPRTFLFPSNEVISNPNITQRTNNDARVFWDNGVTNPAN